MDTLSQSALFFSNLWDDEAHEHYRESLWDALGPSLAPGDVLPWLARRSIVYNERRAIANEEMRREQERLQKDARHGH